jgi:hypothetical protein
MSATFVLRWSYLVRNAPASRCHAALAPTSARAHQPAQNSSSLKRKCAGGRQTRLPKSLPISSLGGAIHSISAVLSEPSFSNAFSTVSEPPLMWRPIRAFRGAASRERCLFSRVFRRCGQKDANSGYLCQAGSAVRRRKAVGATVTAPDAGAENLTDHAYTSGSALGLAVLCEDEASPFQAVPASGSPLRRRDARPGSRTSTSAAARGMLLTLFRLADGRVRVEGVTTCPTRARRRWPSPRRRRAGYRGATVDAAGWRTCWADIAVRGGGVPPHRRKRAAPPTVFTPLTLNSHGSGYGGTGGSPGARSPSKRRSQPRRSPTPSSPTRQSNRLASAPFRSMPAC